MADRIPEGRSPSARPRDQRRMRRAALIAVLFPVFFLLVIAVGVAAMYYHQMAVFKPAAVGATRGFTRTAACPSTRRHSDSEGISAQPV